MITFDDATAADPAHRPAPGGPALFGARWALILGAALLAALALVIITHSLRGRSATPLETVVQQPVPADNAPADNRADVTAPDPGDNP